MNARFFISLWYVDILELSLISDYADFVALLTLTTLGFCRYAYGGFAYVRVIFIDMENWYYPKITEADQASVLGEA